MHIHEHGGAGFSARLNPANMICTCKGFRKTSMCSHVIAATALFVPETYGKEELDNLMQTVTSKRGAKRPRNAVDGTRIQPESDVDSEEELEDEEACFDST